MAISSEYILISPNTLNDMKSGENYLQKKKKAVYAIHWLSFYCCSFPPQSH